MIRESKAPLIRAALVERYPCQAVPHGALTELAAEFDVSRERVRQIAAALGIRGSGQGGNRKPRAMCGSCGTPMPRQSREAICMACRWIELPCEQCSAPVRRLASGLAWRVGNDGRYTGRVFCNRSCFGRWSSARTGWGTGHGLNQLAKHPSYSTYTSGCRCDGCRAAMREYQRNRRANDPKYAERQRERGRAYYARRKQERAR